MFEKINTLVSNPVIKSTVYVTVGSFIGSIFSYLLQVFLGRNLSVEDFGTFTALLSIAVVLAVITNSINTSLIKLVSDLSVKKEFVRLTQLFMEVSVVLLAAGGLVFLVIFLGRAPISSFLSISRVDLFLYFGVFVGVSIISIVPAAYLQGFLRFKAYGFYLVMVQLLRLGFTFLAIRLGLGLIGVFNGSTLAILSAYLIALFILKGNFKKFERTDSKEHLKKLMAFAGSVFFVQVGMTLLNNVDIILVKHFFDETSAGYYAGLVTVGKVLLFGASTVGLVMFPTISAAVSRGDDYLAKFKPILSLQVFIVLVGIAVFTAFPEQITEVMFGEIYLTSAKFLPRFAIFIGLYVLINFMILFLLAIEKVKVFLLLIPAVVLQIVLISIYHNSIVDVINVNLAVSASLLVGVVLYYMKNGRNIGNNTSL